MRYGYVTDLGFLDGDEKSTMIFNSLVECGYDYIELPLTTIALFDKEKYDLFKKTLADNNLPCRANYLIFPHDMILNGPQFDINVIKKHLEMVLPVAADIGSEVVIFGNGMPRSVKEGDTPESVFAQMQQIVETIDPIATKNGVKVVVEPFCKEVTNNINSYQESVDLVRSVNAKNVGGLCDWWHVNKDDLPMDDVRNNPNELFHLHIAYTKDRLIPSLDDISEYADFAGAVKSIGYDNKISIEAFPPDVCKEKIKEGLATMKKLFE